MLPERTTHIGTLQVRGAVRDTPALRLALSSQLGNVEFRPPGMPPSAVLIVRKMADPLPGRLNARGGITHSSPEWERAVQGKVDDFYHRAVRPQRGLLADNTDAILFDDEAEFLACFALDLSSGEAWQRWWWRVIVKSLPIFSGGSVAVSKLFCEKVTCLPAVLELLSKWGKLEVVLRALKTDDARRVLAALLNAYEVKKIAAAIDLPASSVLSTYRDEKKKEVPSWNIIEQTRQRNKGSIPKSYVKNDSQPWSRYLHSTIVTRDLGKEKTCLAGLGMMLYRMPRIVRSPDFQAAVVEWWRFGESNLGVDESQRLGNTDIVEADTNGIEFLADSRSPGKVEYKSSTLRQEGKKSKTSGVRQELVTEKPGSESKEKIHSEVLQTKKTLRSGTEDNQDKKSRLNTVNSSEYKDIASQIDVFVSTHIGGVLYLINLMVQLNLPQCFEKDWRLASQIGPWGLLELLGWVLIGDELTRFNDDPLWSVLAELDGRKPGELPGSGFRGGDSYQLPDSWLEEVETFMDVNNQPYDQPENLKIPGLNEDLLRWLTFTMPYIRYRLQLAFGADSEASLKFFICPGKLFVTSTHVDFITDINNIFIDIRKAGLDCDPGWLADFGRVVMFHFE